jgi:alkylation response protein AidB-like acyl-CoA dehydrogenase
MSAHMTEDQTLLQDAAERYLRDSYDFNQRRERIAGGVYSDPGQWQAFAEMGWLALPVPEEFGGLGMGTREMAILAELCGQFLVTEPLIDALAATHAIIGVSQQQDSVLPRVAEGELIPVAAIDEAGAASRLSPGTTLTQTDAGWHLSGAKHWISAGASATHLAVLAQGAEGLAWVLVPTAADGVECDTFPTHDGRGGMNCRFDLVLEADHILHSIPPWTTPSNACSLDNHWLHFRHYSTACPTCSSRPNSRGH